MEKKIIVLILILCLFPTLALAAPKHEIRINYSQPEDDQYVAGYNLYMEGVQVCSTYDLYSTSMDCVIEAEYGSHTFSMTSTFDDGTESDHSPSYAFTFANPIDTTKSTILQYYMMVILPALNQTRS